MHRKLKRLGVRSRWAEFLTDEERAKLKAIDEAKRLWKQLNLERSTIINRAATRALRAAARRAERDERH